MSEFFILADRIPIPCDLLTWARWFEDHVRERIVQQNTIGDYWVSTVFLGLNHNWLDGPPELFETMVFQGCDGDRTDIAIQRYPTWELALEGHRRTCTMLKMGDWK